MTKDAIAFDKNNYKEFVSESGAHEWGLENYQNWIERVHSGLPQREDESSNIVASYILTEHDGGVSDLLFKYTG